VRSDFPLARRALLMGAAAPFLSTEARAQVATARRIVARANALSERLLALQTGKAGNVVVSPLSLLDALAPLMAGAKDATAQSLAGLFGSPGLAEMVALHKALVGAASLRRATAVWLPRETPPLAAFRKAVAPLGTDIKQIDLASPDAVRQINAWVAERTANLIPVLLDDLPSNASLVSTSALHFAARWANAFDPAETRPLSFHPTRGPARSVPFLRSTRTLPYAESDRWRAVRLAYVDRGFDLTLLLPAGQDAARGAANLLRRGSLTSELNKLRFEDAEVELAFPKVTLNHGVDLKELLRRTPLAPAFGEVSDHRGITGRPQRITAVEQRLALRLNEEGTEAAAATAVTASRAMVERVRFVADWPFLILVTHRPSGLQVIAALVDDPGTA